MVRYTQLKCLSEACQALRREQAFLNTVVRENSTDFWIGLYGLIWEDTFLRTDNGHRRYTNWNVNEPSKHNQSMECVLMNPHKDEGRWRTASCSHRNGFICEIEALPILPNLSTLPTLSTYDQQPGNPLSNEKVKTLPENLLGILFEDKTSQHNISSKNSSFPVIDSNGTCDIKRSSVLRIGECRRELDVIAYVSDLPSPQKIVDKTTHRQSMRDFKKATTATIMSR
ncbi:hypothetical protein pdam_00016955 [Pocillopora damicornis]|uniref:C-type lectin domain-containing protein n=1 Tax=Pocillopora damicornis TaxID=46731 RepID=A0A3M6UUH9_POCDA|nr:hypothetical protein pdam_00016955 [Pocillopora damicornis]